MREPTLPGRTPFGRETRTLFGFAPNWTPLNHGSYGTAPLAVNAERNRYLRATEASPDGFKLVQYPHILAASRAAVAPLIGAHADEVVLVPNATTGTNTIFRNLPWQAGDVVLHFSTVYGACLKTLQSLGESQGVVPVEIEIVYPIEDDELVSRFKTIARRVMAQGKTVKAAVFDTISSGPGVVVPWEELVKVCKELGILSVIDGAHGIGQLDLQHLAKVGPDFMVTNCHKWLFVPRGCAVLYVPFRNQHYIKTTLPTSHGYEAPANRARLGTTSYFTHLFVDVATLDNTTYCVVPHALRFREQVCGGEDAIRAYCHGLAHEGGRRAAQILGTEVMDNRTGTLTRCGMVNVRLPLEFAAAAAAAAGGISDRGAEDGDDVLTVDDGPTVKQWIIDREFGEFDTYIPPNFYHGVMWVRFSAQVYLSIEDFEWGARTLLGLCQRVRKGEWRET